MKFFAFRSIRTRIMTGTTALIVGLMGGVVSVWANTEINLYRQQQLHQARALSKLLDYTLSDQLAEQNWSQIRLYLDLLMQQNEDFVYILVSDIRQQNQIVAASPGEFQEKYIPDIVPLSTTHQALGLSNKDSTTPTFALRDIQFSQKVRAKRGEQLIELASEIRMTSGEKLGTLRIGLSQRYVNRAILHALAQALSVGGLGLFIGLLSSYILARRLSKPILRLQASAAKIAAGDLKHRAEVDISDEIGALAKSFNEMSTALQDSFSKLQLTVESFERFVPDKFLAVIAPEGIENIQVGVASTQTMTILFCDIRGYTSISEMMTPLETFTFLNDYLDCMGQAIDKAGGFIDKYIGDAIMALFDDTQTDCALNAAILMRRSLAEFNEQRRQKGLPKIEIGIGIHRGEVVMGTVGFTSRIESTVVGDAVNLASRVEGLTKLYGCNILLTESVVCGLYYPEQFDLHLVDKSVKVKGKDEEVAIYALQLRKAN
ncbi:MAG: adenylate/guanylate cyclase domain-containing protein [Nostocaceae cyanobacterium]|nr:adenylate/guanylate cyclase domain-containing protein [Nostocaceae cyanobacterium]